MDDSTLRGEIERLVAEERQLGSEATGHGPDDARRTRLAELKVELDRCWDLLRQREAHEEFQLDPDQTSVRDADRRRLRAVARSLGLAATCVGGSSETAKRKSFQ